MKNGIIYHLGNILLIISLLGFVLLAYPLLSLYLFPPEIQKTLPQQGTYITIPKINAQAPITEQVDPWDETIYKKALQKGVAHAKGTALPGEKGTSFLFAHSSGMPWELTQFNTIFLRLGEVTSGDTIIVVRNGRQLQYRVREKKEVLPEEVRYLLQTDTDQLILQTCTPIGTSLRRLLIFADPV